MGRSKQERKIMSDTAKRILLLVLGSISSTLVLAFSVITILYVNDGYFDRAPFYLLWVFVFLGITRFVTFVKDKTRINLVRCLSLLAYDIVLGIVVLFAKHNQYMFCVSAGLYCVSIVLSRVFKIIQNHSIRSIVINAIIASFATVLAIGMFIPPQKEETVSAVILITCVFIAISAFIEVAEFAFEQLRFKVLFQIVLRTFALEILFGLLTMMVASSLVLMTVEPNISSFPDSLWYTFAVVTTIGFGDFVAETIIGRIISVMLGVYGIVVVAVITSIIVNFYNETTGKRDVKAISTLKKEDEKDRREGN